MPKAYYLAYGSNLHPRQLAERVPSAKAMGVVDLSGYQLAFHKKSTDGSGKCMFYAGQDSNQKMYCVLYELDAGEKVALDTVEGVGAGYSIEQIKVTFAGKGYKPFLFNVEPAFVVPELSPYSWYKKLVLAGAKYHGFPADYIEAIKSVRSIVDRDEMRSSENEELLTWLD
jgi:gamma-glutamylcyclotransferase